ncbi:hypothetical protein DWB84_06630 [Saccharophagus sp. K07]|jgi:hypothetical protein|uniref:hypothetical protein n=1 Tax=Saccharophagus sp. K07 TaxID=2283636 RepID=UPI0016529CDC|nr:hypothetical protein [Saccharophagus sp. K07]MBC6905136.1 hypothetical protein [Saccharophagus sp. K07]
MIEYRFPEEKSILLHYAEKMQAELAKQIILKGSVADKKEARVLSEFYWCMVDAAVADEGNGIPVLEAEGVSAWMEYIFHSLNGYLVSNGYAEEWDAE